MDEFLSLYETHVLAPLGEVDEALKGPPRGPGTSYPCPRPASNVFLDQEPTDGREESDLDEEPEEPEESLADPLAMLRHMGTVEYASWSAAWKSRALAWLCDEAMSASTINDLVKRVLEAREVVERRDREVRPGSCIVCC